MENTRSNEKMFLVELDNYATPSFITIYKGYFGTANDILSFVNVLRKSSHAEDYQNVIDNCESFIRGESLPADKEPHLTEVKLLGSKQLSKKDFEYVHLNIWGCPYFIYSDKVKIEVYWIEVPVKNGVEYFRAYQVKFKGLKYKIFEDSDYSKIFCSFWGFPHMIKTEEPTTYNRLLEPEITFPDKSSVLKDMDRLSSVDEIDFSEFFNDIFGDG